MQLIDMGHHVVAIWLTKGDLFGKGFVRIAELDQAMDMIGLLPKNRIILDYPDEGLHLELENVINDLTPVIRQLVPASIMATAFEGGHPDHDAANFICYEALRRSGMAAEIMEFPLYNGNGSFLTGGLTINSFPECDDSIVYTPLSFQHAFKKWKILGIHKSQFRSLAPTKLKFLSSLVTHFAEPHRKCPSCRDHTVPPLPGTDIYQRWFNSSKRVCFNDLVAAISRVNSA